jgi:hypothetical protein
MDIRFFCRYFFSPSIIRVYWDLLLICNSE